MQFVKFYYQPVEQSERSEDGLPVFKDEEYIRIDMNAMHKVQRAVTDDDRRRFGELYKRFLEENEEKEGVEGFPLDLWAVITPSDRMNFKTRGYLTVESVAAIKKSELVKLPPAMALLVKKARDFVKLAGGGTAMTEEAENLRLENEMLKEEVSELKGTISALKAKVAKEAA